MKKLFATAFVLSLFAFGCHNHKCPAVSAYFDVTGARLHYAFKGEDSYWSEFTAFPDSVKFGNFRLGVDFDRRYYSVNQPAGFSLVPAAYALSCVEPGDGGTTEKITGIELITLADYNANYPAGSTLNPILQIDQRFSVPGYLDYANQNGLNQFGFQLDLSEKPDPAVKQAFKLIFKLDTGEIYEAQTNPAIIY